MPTTMKRKRLPVTTKMKLLGHIFLHGIMSVMPISALPAIDAGPGAEQPREPASAICAG